MNGVKRLSELARAVGGAVAGEDVDITGLAVDSRAVRAGDLFMALPGTRDDGFRYITDAVGRGARAVMTHEAVRSVPTIVVRDPRRAVAPVAAAFHGHPARRLRLIGITGTLGKTSTSLLLETALAAAGASVGALGSLGVRQGVPRAGTVGRTARLTTPDAPSIHATLARFVEAGIGTAVMEVTSHGILQERVGALEFALGIFTNLVPDEHLEYHPTAEHYVETKLRFVDLLARGAPLVHASGDARVASRAGERGVAVGLGGTDAAPVTIGSVQYHLNGVSFILAVARELRGPGGLMVAPTALPIALPLLGRHQLANAALAATAALLLGVEPDAICAAFESPPPLRRRMEVVWPGRPLVIDDTVGNPRSLRAVFDSVQRLGRHGLRVAFGIRGGRGVTINRQLAATLAEQMARLSRAAPVRLVVTASADAASGANRVSDDERAVVVEVLDRAGTPYVFEPTLAAAVHRILDGCRPDELVLLLGAQGMDGAAELVRGQLRTLSGVARNP
ncbi:MAG TPA: Mur ligase family protein [Gemmatimonadales bacterium]|nr:Mur ligase family protein [Gemmatimonadales bacterium]